jgi:hypothetical protein
VASKRDQREYAERPVPEEAVRRSLDAGSRAVPQVVGHLPEQRQRGRPKRRPIIPRSSGAMPSPAIAANSVVRLRGRAAASTSAQASEPALLARRSEPRSAIFEWIEA